MTWHRTTWNVLKGDKVRKLQIETWQIFQFRQIFQIWQIFQFWMSTEHPIPQSRLHWHSQINLSIYRIYENQSIELHYSNLVFQICASFARNCKLQVPHCLDKKVYRWSWVQSKVTLNTGIWNKQTIQLIRSPPSTHAFISTGSLQVSKGKWHCGCKWQ